MSQALTTYNGATLAPVSHNEHAFEPGNLGQALELAKVLHAGGLLPKSFNRPEAVVTAIILGRELGLSAMQSIRGIHVIEGKPTLSADMMVALVKRSPVCKFFRLVSSTDTEAVYETHRADEPEPVRMGYAKEQAILAGKWGAGTWKAHPAAMLRARASSALARAVYPDVVAGVYDPDELEPVQWQPQATTVTVVRDDSRTVDTVTGEVLSGDPLAAYGGQDNQLPTRSATAATAPPSEPRDAWSVANKRVRAVLRNAQKALDLPGATMGAMLHELMAASCDGLTSAKDCTPDQLGMLADLIEADPKVLVFVAEFEPPIPPFEPEAPFADGHTGSIHGIESEG